MQSVIDDGFMPRGDWFFPYSLQRIGKNGKIPRHLYLSATLRPTQIAGEGNHYLMVLSLPRIRTFFVGGDTPANWEKDLRAFNTFYQEGIVFSEQTTDGFYTYPRYSDFGGIIVVPDDLKIIRGIGVAIRQISQEEWNKTPWGEYEEYLKTRIDLSSIPQIEKWASQEQLDRRFTF